MELWIRSQKNEKLRQGLFKVNEIELGDYDNDMNCLVINNLYCVGIYKTKERAIEVLDEIQSLLQPTIEYKPIVQEEYNPAYAYKYFVKVDDNIEIKELSTFVYQMPEK